MKARIDPSLKQELIQKALDGQKKAYAPYSGFYVGSAVLTKTGKIFLGCNIENASYGLSNCAERTALFNAISSGEKEITAIAVVTQEGTMPCGACRQVLFEFNPNMTVIAVNRMGKIQKEIELNELLANAFGPACLNEPPLRRKR